VIKKYHKWVTPVALVAFYKFGALNHLMFPPAASKKEWLLKIKSKTAVDEKKRVCTICQQRPRPPHGKFVLIGKVEKKFYD